MTESRLVLVLGAASLSQEVEVELEGSGALIFRSRDSKAMKLRLTPDQLRDVLEFLSSVGGSTGGTSLTKV